MKSSHPVAIALLFTFAGTFLGSAQAQESVEVFSSANEDFESGDLNQAEMKYRRLVENGRISSDLYFNLGTTQYRLEEPGEAMLWFRRALVVEPRAPEVPQNVANQRTKLG